MAEDEKVVGAALVVGGGIAGVQAALDLADSGIKVYLLERAPAIGGKMAQLDKTFPTNDCAMCIVSPKLVEAGRHINIDIIPSAELICLEGSAGNFTARIRRHPRYVDMEKCTGCADCEAVCPVSLPNEFNQGLDDRKAIYRSYPQAVPNTYLVTKLGTSPCKNRCPAETSAQGYVALIAQGRYADALEVVKQYNPFPATVGRVCNHPCEDECNRGKLDSPVAICALKRFVADWVHEHPGEQVEPAEEALPPERKGERVAVVGAGPAGFSAAHHLARMGYEVTIFEALPVAGGMMRVGIPAYRLPREVLEREIDDILKLGVELKLNTPIRNIDRLLEAGYRAVFVAIGAHEPQRLGIPGETVRGVHHGVPFLQGVSLAEKAGLMEGFEDRFIIAFGIPIAPRVGEKTVVIGGGNTATDAARTALRLGAKEVSILYRRSRDEMPANPWEVDEAENEGIQLQVLTAPVEVLEREGHVNGIRCVRMKLGEPDESGRRRPIPIEGSEFVIPADTMIAAVAQAPEVSFLEESTGLEITRQGTFVVDPRTLATTKPGVFAGGDAAKGPGTLIEAIADGRRAALSIDRYLRGVELLTPREELPLPVVELSREEVRARAERGELDLGPRVHIPVVAVEERTRDFREVELPLSQEQARAEASRCLSCGLCSECYRCVDICKAEAVDHQQVAVEQEIQVGAVVLSPGYALYDPKHSPEFGYGRYANVLTSMEFERMLSASGPTQGHIARPSDHREPKRIAFLQCIGSRDQRHDYCSSVCCMYATKEAMLAMEHVVGLEPTIFQMDMRAFGKGFDEYFERGRSLGIRYIRCRISELEENPETGDLLIRYRREGSKGSSLEEERFDLAVLSVGMESLADAGPVAKAAGIGLDDRGFCLTRGFHPVETTRPGVFACGAFTEPKDIPDSVTQSSGAAAAALSVIGEARGTLTREKAYPPEMDVSKEESRIGAFICSCGSNIAGVVDVKALVDYATTLPGVVHAENTIYTCSADSLKLIQERVKEFNLNRVVVASCTPRTHEPLFRDTIREAGLNPYLFEMANIRDQCSWVHSGRPEEATRKAKDLLRMAVRRSRVLIPLYQQTIGVNQACLVVGGGVAGMNAALSLADQGYRVFLVERERELGGRMRRIHLAADGQDPGRYLEQVIDRVLEDDHIEVLAGHRVVETGGFKGNFKTTVEATDSPRRQLIEHGATILATGGVEYRGKAYSLGSDPRVITQEEFERMVARRKKEVKGLKSVVMIQCVGPWNDDESIPFYCSRICCSVAMKNAIEVKEANPAASVTVLYRDIRTYGFQEDRYTEARRRGVIFVRYDWENLPRVSLGNGRLRIEAEDPILGKGLLLEPDLLVLSEAVVPSPGSEEVATLFKVPRTLEGFFLEAHVKLRPVDFPADGIYLCGMAHYPKSIDETLAQAQAAVARASTILSREAMEVGGVVAHVDGERCAACLTCVRVCPYEVPAINPKGEAEIEVARCQGCGACAAECPAKAIQLGHYRDDQLLAKCEAMAREEAG
jgi:heterodisulfide reductase subunit A-like polyferredoxin